MELKFSKSITSLMSLSCSNRTFMELKFNFYLHAFWVYKCSNRTFMELKYVSAIAYNSKVVF